MVAKGRLFWVLASVACKQAFRITSTTSLPYARRSAHCPLAAMARASTESIVAPVRDIWKIALSGRINCAFGSVNTVEHSTLAAFVARHSVNAEFTASVICF